MPCNSNPIKSKQWTCLFGNFSRFVKFYYQFTNFHWNSIECAVFYITCIFVHLCTSVEDYNCGNNKTCTSPETGCTRIIGGSCGGACRAHALTYGTQFFHFHIHFHQKEPASEVYPSNGCTPPPTGNPGSAAADVRFHNMANKQHLPIINHYFSNHFFYD